MLGVGLGSVQQWESGKNKMSKTAAILLSVCTSNAQSSNIKSINNFKIAAGTGTGVVMESDISDFRLDDILTKGYDYYAYEVEGQSMEPLLFQGEVLICSQIDPKEVINPNSSRFKDGYVFVFYSGYDNESTVKRTVRNFSGGILKDYTFRPDNPTYESFTKPADPRDKFYVVRRRITKQMPELRFADDYQALMNEISELKTMVLDLSATKVDAEIINKNIGIIKE